MVLSAWSQQSVFQYRAGVDTHFSRSICVAFYLWLGAKIAASIALISAGATICYVRTGKQSSCVCRKDSSPGSQSSGSSGSKSLTVRRLSIAS